MTLTKTLIEIYFDAFNKTIFNNALDRNFPCKVSSSRKVGGYVISIDRFNMVKSFHISKCFAVDRLSIEDIILHEMIHVYLTQKGIIDTAKHGKYFCAMVKDINSKFKRHVSKQYLSSTIPKTVFDKKYAILEIIGKGVIFFSPKADLKFVKQIYAYNNRPIKIGYIKDPILEHYSKSSIKTILKASSYYPYTETIRTKILPKVQFIYDSEKKKTPT